MGLLYFTVAAVGAALQIRQPVRWRWVFILLSAGLALLGLQIGQSVLLPDSGPIFAGLGILGLASALLAALGCSALDLTASERYDLFHWTGVAVLFASLCHVFVLWGITASIRG